MDVHAKGDALSHTEIIARFVAAFCADCAAGVKEKSRSSANEVRTMRTLLRMCRVFMGRLLASATKLMTKTLTLRQTRASAPARGDSRPRITGVIFRRDRALELDQAQDQARAQTRSGRRVAHRAVARWAPLWRQAVSRSRFASKYSARRADPRGNHLDKRVGWRWVSKPPSNGRVGSQAFLQWPGFRRADTPHPLCI